MLVRWGCDGSKPHRSEESEGEQSDLDDGMKVHIPLNPTWSGSDTGNVNRKTHTGRLQRDLQHKHAGSPSSSYNET